MQGQTWLKSTTKYVDLSHGPPPVRILPEGFPLLLLSATGNTGDSTEARDPLGQS